MSAKEKGPVAANDQAPESASDPQHSKPMRYRWWDAVMADSELTARDTAVAMVLSSHGRLDGTSIFPSKETLAKECKVSERTVYRALRTLKARGYLVDVSTIPKAQRSAKGWCTVYRLALPSESRREPSPENPQAHLKAPDTGDKAPDTSGTEHLTPMADQQTMGNRPISEHSATDVAAPSRGDGGDANPDDPWSDDPWSEHLVAEQAETETWADLIADEDWPAVMDRIEMLAGGFEPGEQAMADAMLCREEHPVYILNVIDCRRNGPVAERRAQGAAA